MTALSAITIKGFRSIGSVEDLAIRPINVLIGANGSGKSNFLGVFKLLQAIRAGRLQDYVARAGGADRLLHFGSKVTEELVIRLTFGDQYPEYEVTLDPVHGDWMRSSQTVRSWSQGELLPSQITSAAIGPASEADSGNTDSPHSARHAVFGTAAEHSQPRDLTAEWNMAVADILNDSERWHVYHFLDTGSNSPIKTNNDLHDNRFLRPDGANLAAFLYLLHEQYASSYDLIRRTTQFVAPFFEDFHLEPLALNPDKIRLEWQHKRSDAYFDASSLSDGTLRFMALATLLLQPEALRPSVILVDEPELGLHPYAILNCWPRWSSRPPSGAGSFWQHGVADPAGPFRPGRRARDRPDRRQNDVQASQFGRPGSMAGGLQPGAVMGKERAWRPPRQSVDGAAAE